MALHNEIGKIGETLAETFLMKHGFNVLQRNFSTRYGEIDIVARKDSKLRLVEVKSVKVSSFDHLKSLSVQPEENLTKAKWDKIVASSHIYLSSQGVSPETKWQIDLVCVYVNTNTREGRVVFMENIHLD